MQFDRGQKHCLLLVSRNLKKEKKFHSKIICIVIISHTTSRIESLRGGGASPLAECMLGAMARSSPDLVVV